jgi:hypothetical protein
MTTKPDADRTLAYTAVLKVTEYLLAPYYSTNGVVPTHGVKPGMTHMFVVSLVWTLAHLSLWMAHIGNSCSKSVSGLVELAYNAILMG